MTDQDIPIESHIEVVIGDVVTETADIPTTAEPQLRTQPDGDKVDEELYVCQVSTNCTVRCKEDCHDNNVDHEILRDSTRRLKDTMKKRLLRQDEGFRKKEAQKAKQRMMLKRTNPAYREMERERDRERRAIARRKNTESRAKERERDRKYKQEQRVKYGRKLYPTNVVMLSSTHGVRVPDFLDVEICDKTSDNADSHSGKDSDEEVLATCASADKVLEKS